MDRPEVWMSDAATPLRRSTAVIEWTAEFAWCSAAATELPLVCTPIDSASWFGAPDTFPVPVTVIRVPPGAGTAVAALSVALPVAPSAVALPWPAPRVNAPMSRPADATPTATARWVEENWTAMAPLPRHSGMRHRLDAPAAHTVPGSPGSRVRLAPLALAEVLGQLRDALHERGVLAHFFLGGSHCHDRRGRN